MINKIILLCLINIVHSYILPHTFKHWHCINFDKNIDKTKPYIYNIGDLSLVTWFDQKNLTKSFTNINICKHMGSKFDKGKIIDDCLVCPYHNIKYNDICGETIIYQNKLWWSYKPFNKLPPNTPLYNNNNYESILIEKDINTNIIDCMINILDFNHQKNILSGLKGHVAATAADNLNLINIETIKINNKNKLGIKFIYDNFKIYYVFEYPYTSYYYIFYNNQKIIININLLPLSNNKTKWLINIKYNNYKSYIIKSLINLISNFYLNYNEKKLFNVSQQLFIKKFITYNFNNDNNLNIYNKYINDIYQKYNNYLFPDEFCIKNFIKNLRFY